MLSPEREDDLDGLCSGIFEYEYEDFLEQLRAEPLYLEEEIVTEEDVEILNECGFNDPKVYEIGERAAKHPECRHIYALAYRIYMDYVENYREKKEVVK